jgi:hypothetical protein
LIGETSFFGKIIWDQLNKYTVKKNRKSNKILRTERGTRKFEGNKLCGGKAPSQPFLGVKLTGNG